MLVGCAPPTALTPPPEPGAGMALSQGPAEGVELEVGPDGVVFVGWIEEDTYHLAWSADAVRFESVAVRLDGVTPRASLAREPRLAVGEDRVAIALSDGITLDARVLLAVADRVGGGVGDFEVLALEALDPAAAAEGLDFDTLDQPVAAFAPDGSLVASWKVALDHDYAIVTARESDGFTPTYAAGFPGQPCECCPHELAFDAGELLLLQRSNEANLREIHLGRQGADGFAVTRVSRNGWYTPGCPFDGPDLAFADGALFVSWMDATPGLATAWVARSDDGGATFTNAMAPLDEPVAQVFPTVAGGEGGPLWLATEELYVATWLLRSDDGGATWEEVATVPITGAEVASAGGRTGLAGLDEDQRVRWLPLEGSGSPRRQ